MMTYRLFIVIFLKDLISTGKPKKLMNQKGSVAIIAAIALVAGITTSIVPQAFASAVDDQKDQRCAPRLEFNGKDNAGNEHNDANGNPDQVKNPHDEQNGFTKGNPHDRCVGS